MTWSFSPSTKKMLLVLLFLTSAIVIALLLFFVFFRPMKIGNDSTLLETPEDQGIFPQAKEGEGNIIDSLSSSNQHLPQADQIAKGGITKTNTITSVPVVSAEIQENQMQYYNEQDGKFYRVNEKGEIQTLSNTSFPQAQTVTWNQQVDKAILEFPDGSNIVYDFSSGHQVTLPKHWEDFHFSADDKEIIAKSMGLDSNNRALVVSNTDGSNVQAVQALGDHADKVMVVPSPQGQIIAFSDTASEESEFGKSFIVPLGKNQENFKGLTIEGFGFEPLWSPRGDYLLYSASGESSNNLPLLWLVNGSINALGENRHSLGLNTWVEKCTFAGISSVYCAVPTSLPAYAGLQKELANGIPDLLYKIDLTTGRLTRMGTTDTGASMINLRVSKDEQLLYFINEETGLLESMYLK
jgi:hypothetical protein